MNVCLALLHSLSQFVMRYIPYLRLLHIASRKILVPRTRVVRIRVLICAFGHVYRVMRSMITHLWTGAHRMLIGSAYICWLRCCKVYSDSLGCRCSLCRSVNPYLFDD